MAPVEDEVARPLLRRRKERDHFEEDSPLVVMRAAVAQNVVDLLTIQNLYN